MNVLHWTQMVRSGLVSKYDYGTRHENIEKYGQATPPLYDFTKVNTDMYLYWSPKDWVADETDITEYLLNVLPQEYIKVSFRN
jgi:lysosomal acid lipase/cholesteryl ester hydrolase